EQGEELILKREVYNFESLVLLGRGWCGMVYKLCILQVSRSHSPELRSMRGRGNAPETGRGAEPGESRACSSKPPQNPRPLGRGGGQPEGRVIWEIIEYE
ncbi:MAG: hypothetical protein QXO85_03560, partial [Sulfolobales archaeon]